MPSPFPGMDPFLEGQLWADFHGRFVPALGDALVPLIRPRYVALIEERVYLEHPPEDAVRIVRPDVSVATEARRPLSAASGAKPTPSVAVALAMPETVRERYLTLRLRDSRELITVVELLSPSNKRPHSDGRREYLSKRDAILQSGVHLVELDFLRGGGRVPMAGRLPDASYYVIVSRSPRRPMADVWPVQLSDRLPVIPIPLAEGDPDAVLDLQAVFSEVYDRAGYDYAVDYGREVEPGLGAGEAAWVRELRPGSARPD